MSSTARLITRVSRMAAMLVIAIVALPGPAAAELRIGRLPAGTQETGLFTVSPDRWEGDVEPGTTATFEINLVNRTGADATIELLATDTEPAEGAGTVNAVQQAVRFGAGAWVVPEVAEVKLANMEEAFLDVSITPPVEAPVGSNFGGLLAILHAEAPTTGEGKVGADLRALLQIYPRVPGQIEHKIELTGTRVADSFLFTGNRYVAYEVQLENKGNVHEYIEGKVSLESMFGNELTELEIPETLVLRGIKRNVRVLWSKPPAFGRFSGTVSARSTQQKLKRDLPAVTILPPWWWFGLVVGVLALPVAAWWWRRRQSWKAWLDEDEDLGDDQAVAWDD